MAEHVIHLSGGGDEEAATLATDDPDDVCHITFQYRGRTLSAEAEDFFDAFSQIRVQLDGAVDTTLLRCEPECVSVRHVAQYELRIESAPPEHGAPGAYERFSLYL